MSFAEKILDKKRVSIRCVQKNGEDGQPYFCYVVLKKTRVDEFQEKVKNDDMNFDGLATVLHTGVGVPMDEDDAYAMHVVKNGFPEDE